MFRRARTQMSDDAHHLVMAVKDEELKVSEESERQHACRKHGYLDVARVSGCKRYQGKSQARARTSRQATA